MIAIHGKKSDGTGLSEHTLDNTGPREHLVIEFDGISSLDHQAGIIAHLAGYAPLWVVVFSGNKSLHAWFRVGSYSESELRPFFAYAVRLGADPATWVRSLFVRLPGGWNNNYQVRQEVYYLKHSEAMSVLPPPPGSPAPFPWEIKLAETQWTADPRQIDLLSSPPLVDGLIREGDVGTLVGGAKTSKTWIALRLAICVAGGLPFIGRTTRATKALYLDYELKEGTFLKRLSMLARSAPKGLIYQTLRGSRLPSLSEIAELIVSQGIGFLVLDSLYRTGLIREENSNDSTSQDLTALQGLAAQTGVSILVVDHTAKGAGNDRSAVDASRGASAKGGFFDFIMVLRPAPKSEDQKALMVMMDAVVRDWPTPKDLPVIAVKWGAHSCDLELAGSVPQDDPNLTCTRLLETLQKSGVWMGSAQIISASGIPDTTVRTVLKKLEASGRVISEQDPGHSQRRRYRIQPPLETPRIRINHAQKNHPATLNRNEEWRGFPPAPPSPL